MTFLPDLKTMTPSNSSFNKVVKFSKATGDFLSLSNQDI